jgi:hypothetical protein
MNGTERHGTERLPANLRNGMLGGGFAIHPLTVPFRAMLEDGIAAGFESAAPARSRRRG